MITRLLARLPPLSRPQWQVATGLVTLVVLALVALLLRPALASLAEVREQRVQAEQETQVAELLRQLHRGLELELTSSKKEPISELAGFSDERTLIKLIGEINEVAIRHQVAADRLAPAPVRKVAMFDELSVDAELTGQYAQLSAVLLDVTQGLPWVSVSAFQIDRSGTGQNVKMTVRFSVYLEEKRQK